MGNKPVATLSILLKEITEIKADVIVNAAYYNLEPGEGIDEAIRRAGGPGLEAEIEQLRQASNGGLLESGVIRTSPHDFKNCTGFLLHVIGPHIPNNKKKHTPIHEQQLRLCYLNTLKICAAERMESVVIPFICVGTSRYPMEEAVKVALQTVFGFFEAFEPSTLLDISFVTADKAVFDAVQKISGFKSDDDNIELDLSKSSDLRNMLEESLHGHQRDTMPLNDTFRVASFVRKWGSGTERRTIQKMTFSEEVLQKKKDQIKRNNRKWKEMYPEKYQAGVELKRERRLRERKKVLRERKRAEKEADEMELDMKMWKDEEVGEVERKWQEMADSEDEMYLVVKCKSKEQYEAVQKELQRRNEAVFDFGVAAGPDDLIWKQGTQKPIIPLKDQKPNEDEDDYTPPNSYFPYVSNFLPGPEDRPGPNGSFYHYSSIPSPDEFDQADLDLEDEICVKEEPMDEDLYLDDDCAPSTSRQLLDVHSSNTQYTSEGGVSAHLLMSLDDGDEDPLEDEPVIEVAPEETTHSAMLERRMMNHDIKAEEATEGYVDPQNDIRPSLAMPFSRTVTQKCMKEGCMDTVSYKSSTEWSMKCHHVFSHYPDIQYECPLCGYSSPIRLVVCRHLRVTHNQGFTPLFHAVCKHQTEVPKLRAIILECFPGTPVDTPDPTQTGDQNSYQPSVRAVMQYYVRFPKPKPVDQKRPRRNRCTRCKACISRGPLEFRLKCEHALTHSTIPWIKCSLCDEHFVNREDFIAHAKEHKNGTPARPFSRHLNELNTAEIEAVEKFAAILFPDDPSEPVSQLVRSRLIPLSEFVEKPEETLVVAESSDGGERRQPAKRGRKRKNAA